MAEQSDPSLPSRWLLKAQLDAEIAALDPVAIRAIERTFSKAGVEFIVKNGGLSVRLRKAEA